jgi:pyrroloquinoline quinone biosynthesis protein B
VAPRTQSSLAVSVDGRQWLVVNASPDIRSQIAATPELQPKRSGRDSPLAALLLTNGDVDHVAGLLSLRERQPFRLYATAEILSHVGANRIFDVADPAIVPREPVALERRFEPFDGLSVQLFAVPGKVPLWLEDERLVIGVETESTVGLLIETDRHRVVYIPGCAGMTPALRDRIAGASLLLFDGTLWQDDEMINAGVGEKTGGRMGHMSMSGREGSIAALADVDVRRRVFVHINNTNPTLVEGSPEREAVERAGWLIAYDGLRFAL